MEEEYYNRTGCSLSLLACALPSDGKAWFLFALGEKREPREVEDEVEDLWCSGEVVGRIDIGVGQLVGMHKLLVCYVSLSFAGGSNEQVGSNCAPASTRWSDRVGRPDRQG